MKKLYLLITLLTIFLFILIACNNNENEGIPAYIKIDTVFFYTTNSQQGTSSNNISDVWVYVDNQHVGTYELPAFFPVLKSGEHTLLIRPGIKVNGISASRMYYPFYSRDTIYVNLIPGQITSITGDTTPSFTYIPQTNFAWMEDFEDLQSDLVKSTKTNTVVHIYNDINLDQQFGGKACGQIVIQDSTTFFEVFNTNKLENIPHYGENVYLEMNYKIDGEMTVGIYAYYEGSSNIVQSAIVRLNPTKEWKKIYIYLTNTISTYFNADSYRIYLKGGNITLDTISRTEFYIDNLKLVY